MYLDWFRRFRCGRVIDGAGRSHPRRARPSRQKCKRTLSPSFFRSRQGTMRRGAQPGWRLGATGAPRLKRPAGVQSGWFFHRCSKRGSCRPSIKQLAVTTCSSTCAGASEPNLRLLPQSAMRSFTAWRISCFVPKQDQIDEGLLASPPTVGQSLSIATEADFGLLRLFRSVTESTRKPLESIRSNWLSAKQHLEERAESRQTGSVYHSLKRAICL